MYQKPFLKWVGGKTQIIDSIIGKFPKKMNNYHEIFLGGGSVLLALLTLVNEKKIVIKGTINAYDINKNLILCLQEHSRQYRGTFRRIDHFKGRVQRVNWGRKDKKT